MTERQCGDCQLCCRLLPVKTVINKPANTRCQHQRHGKGCAVYHRPEKGFPWECELWNCVWLRGPDAAELRRPDRSHYVIDVLPDYVTQTFDDGQKRRFPVVQIWADPKFPDCHRDPELRAWLERRNMMGLVRNGNDSAILLVPPALMDTGQWFEKTTDVTKEQTHSFAQILEALGAA